MPAVLRYPKTNIVVTIRWIVVVTVRRATIVIVVVPRPAATNPGRLRMALSCILAEFLKNLFFQKNFRRFAPNVKK